MDDQDGRGREVCRAAPGHHPFPAATLLFVCKLLFSWRASQIA